MAAPTPSFPLSQPANPAETAAKLAEARRLLTRCEERDARSRMHGREAHREHDDEGVWTAMASRAENERFAARLRTDIAALELALAAATV